MKIFIIGSGKVAKALGKSFLKAGHKITGVAGRTSKNRLTLARKLKCKAFTFADIPNGSDIYVIAVKDDVIARVASLLPELNGIVVHTSGSTPLNALGSRKNKGVFYPVQTINDDFSGLFTNVPICVECRIKSSRDILIKAARSISTKVYTINEDQRQALHLAAVFTNNFTNHLLAMAQQLLEKNRLPFEMTQELAKATVSNAFKSGPLLSQTGPAVRNDRKTIARHLAMLKSNEAYRTIYNIITREIIRVHKLKKAK